MKAAGRKKLILWNPHLNFKLQGSNYVSKKLFLISKDTGYLYNLLSYTYKKIQNLQISWLCVFQLPTLLLQHHWLPHIKYICFKIPPPLSINIPK